MVIARAITVRHQRTEMYIVISKPKRKSWYSGVIQVMNVSYKNILDARTTLGATAPNQ